MTDFFVESGVISTGLTLENDELYVRSGGVAHDTTTRVAGFEYVDAGGLASGTVVSSGGYENIRSGGLGLDTVVSDGGYEWVDGVAIGVTLNNGATEMVRSGGVASATVVRSGAIENVLADGTASDTIIEGGTLNLLSGGTASGSITFGTATAGRLIIEGTQMPTATISGFALGDTIDLTSIGSGGVVINDPMTDRVTIIGSLGSATLQFAVSDNLNFITTPDNGQQQGILLGIACYCRGTMILTPNGEVPIEELAIGDRVVTLTGKARPIRWVGHRSYVGPFTDRHRDVLPICFRSNAIRTGVPAHDLSLSPEHSLYIDDVLVQAKHLINGVTITQADNMAAVEYFHIELDEHDVIFANNTPAETFVDCDNRLMFANSIEYAKLYPHDDRSHWQFCAPRLEWGSAELVAIRQRIFSQARKLMDAPSSDFHAVADGTAMAPVVTSGLMRRFEIAAGVTSLWLASDSFVPAQHAAISMDTRRLGVPIERILLSNATLSTEIWHDHRSLSEGFYEDEGTHRWTNGLARVPDVLLRPFSDGFTLDIYLSEPVESEQVVSIVRELEDAL